MKAMGTFVFGIAIASSILMASACGTKLAVPQIDSKLVEQEQKKQKLLYIKKTLDRSKRIARVSFPLITANREFCEQNVFRYGFHFISPKMFNENYRQTVLNFYGDQLTIIDVTPGSPMEKAGVAEGSKILKINKKDFEHLEDVNEALGSKSRSRFELIDPEGVRSVVEVAAVQVCDMPINIMENSEINAFADGSQIFVTTGMMRFLEDDELALVIGHEMAHNTLGHLTRSRTNQIIGGFAGLLLDVVAAAAGVNTQTAGMRAGMQAGQQAYSKEFELEADYLGVYFAARAGSDVTDAANMWRKMAQESHGQTNEAAIYSSTHPGSAERFVKIEAAMQEVQDKLARKEPLMPAQKK